MGPSVLAVIAPGSEEMEAVIVIDILRRADIAVTVASADPDQRLLVQGSRQTWLQADCLIADCDGRDFDLIYLPGGVPGVDNLAASAALNQRLLAQHRAQRWIAAICAAPAVVLEPLGILQGRRVAGAPGFMARIQSALPVDQARCLRDGHCLTSRGPGTAMEFAFFLVAILLGAPAALRLGEPMALSFDLAAMLGACD